MLTRSGWISAFFIALIIILSGLGVYLIYPITFLIFGSLISRLNPKNSDNHGRNSFQVIANAGVAGILAFLYLLSPDPIFPIALAISFSVALSDTFSSEIGKRYGGTPYNICRFSSMQIGLSGGISILGTLGGLLGSILISTIFFLHQYDFKNAILVLIFGFLGMLIDSVIGCSLQAKYKEGELILETGNRVNLIGGFHFINNNVTNFLSILITVVIYLVACF